MDIGIESVFHVPMEHIADVVYRNQWFLALSSTAEQQHKALECAPYSPFSWTALVQGQTHVSNVAFPVSLRCCRRSLTLICVTLNPTLSTPLTLLRQLPRNKTKKPRATCVVQTQKICNPILNRLPSNRYWSVVCPPGRT